MGWWKKKKMKMISSNVEISSARADDENQCLVRAREGGALLLEDLIKCCDGKSNPIKFFSQDQIFEATDDLSDSNYIFSPSYRYACFSGKNHQLMLIGRHIDEGENTFCRDIAISSMVSGHKNFLKLVGCCLEFQYPAIVYRDVKKHYKLDLSDQPWKRRMKIAEDIATALAYLHTAFPRPFVYRTMSLGNILLDEDGVAKLCDFTGCVSIPQGETFVKVDELAGYVEHDYSFMEVDYFKRGLVSEKTDVFAIGILMQKLLTGEERFIRLQMPDDYFPGLKFRGWLSKSMEEERMEEIADPKIIEEMGEISEEELCRMKSFLMLSFRCIGERGEVPTMVEVAKELKKIQRSL